MAVQDKEKDDVDVKQSISPDFLRESTGIGKDEEQAMEQEAYSGAAEDIGTRLQDGEVSGSTPTATEADSQESARLGSADSDDDEGWYKGDGTKRRVKFLTRRRAVAGGGAVAIITGVFAMFSILQGPFQVIHFSQLLQLFHFSNNEDFSDSRTGKMFIYLATLDDPSRRNLGVVGNRFANRYKGLMNDAGISMSFEDTSRNGKRVRRVQSFTVDSNKPAGKRVITDLKKQNVPLENLPDGRIKVNVRGQGGTAISRNVLRGGVDGIGLNKISGSIAYRIMARRARVDFHPLKNRVYEARQETRDAYNRRIQDEDSSRDKTGVDEPDGRVGGVQEDTDGDGKTDNDTTSDAADGQAEVDAAKNADGPDGLRNLRTRYASLIKGGGLAGAGVGVVCAARGLGDQAEAIEHANIILPLIRIGTRIVSTGTQVMAGQGLNLDELGAVTATFNSDEFGSWASAKSIQAEMGKEPIGPDIPEEAKPSQVGEKPTLFRILDNSALGAACGVNDTIGGLPIIKQVGQVSDAAINGVLSTFGWSMERLMENLASLFAAEQISDSAAGVLLGGYANYGARLAANDHAISMGGRQLSDTETAQLDAESRIRHQNIIDSKSLFARVFDIYDAESVVASVAREVPTSPSSALASLVSAPARLLSPLIRPASAQSEYDYGFDEFGFSLDEQNDERLEDPMENADLIEPILERLNRKYEGCFNTVVSPANGSISSGEAVRYDQIAEDNDCSDPGARFPDGTTELLRYRMYLADMMTIHSLACYEGDGSSCQQLGFGGDAPSGEIPEIVAGDTSHLSCEAGVDGGVVPGYQEGQEYSIRVCIVQGITVNAQIAKATDSMLNAARAAGINITGSGFRTMEGQRDAYERYQNGGNEAARPGYSNHQMGLAIDINYSSELGGVSLTRCQANPSRYPTYEWLAANAASYGFSAKVTSECWHWSVTGG